MPRKKQFDPEVALEQAMELFWEQGYEATSIQDLLDHLGLNRFSLYDTFQGKKDLFHAAQKRYRESQTGPLLSRMRESPSGLDSIRHFFDLTLARLTGPAGWWGCFMVNCAVEMAPRDRGTARMVEEHLQEQEEAFYRALVRARKAGEVRTLLPARPLARFLSQSVVSLNVMARTRVPARDLNQHIGLAFMVLE